VQLVQIGASIARFFGVSYEPFKEGRIRSEQLLGSLKREFLEVQGWIPLEDGPEGLLIMCMDPEAVRGARVVPQVFPRVHKFVYRVTTQTEFRYTLDQLLGADVQGGSIDQMLADMDGPLDDGGGIDDALESAAADNELVKFVNKIIIDAYHQKASDIHIEPMPGKFKTGIRFRIDGSLVPYIEVPAGDGYAPQDHV
jgi:type II secretory ATPase GspE/PulE/Tfp pilus assembly ATPase PilB-like protein